MAKNTLNDQYIDVVVVEMGSQAVAQSMAGYIKGDTYRRVKLIRTLGSDHDNMLVIQQKNPIRIPFVMLRSHFLRVKTVL